MFFDIVQYIETYSLSPINSVFVLDINCFSIDWLSLLWKKILFRYNVHLSQKNKTKQIRPYVLHLSNVALHFENLCFSNFYTSLINWVYRKIKLFFVDKLCLSTWKPMFFENSAFHLKTDFFSIFRGFQRKKKTLFFDRKRSSSAINCVFDKL